MSNRRQFQDWFEKTQGESMRCGVCLGWQTEDLLYEAWTASRQELIEELRKLNWAPCVLQEAIDASGIEPK